MVPWNNQTLRTERYRRYMYMSDIQGTTSNCLMNALPKHLRLDVSVQFDFQQLSERVKDRQHWYLHGESKG